MEVAVPAAAGRVFAAIWKNGAEMARGNGTTFNASSQAGSQNINVGDVVFCSAGDYIEFYAYNGFASSTLSPQPGAVFTYMSVVQVGVVNQTPVGAVTARMFRTAAYTGVANTSTKMPFDTVDFDTSGVAQIANSRLIAPVAGYYQGLQSVQQNGVYADTQAYVNNVLALQQRFGGG